MPLSCCFALSQYVSVFFHKIGAVVIAGLISFTVGLVVCIVVAIVTSRNQPPSWQAVSHKQIIVLLCLPQQHISMTTVAQFQQSDEVMVFNQSLRT